MERKGSKGKSARKGWGVKLGLSRKQEPVETFSTRKSSRKPFVRSEVSAEAQKAVHEKREKLKDEAVQALPEGYFEQYFEPPLFELQRMPPNFEASDLDGIVEERANVLEIVSERLSKHVLANYDVFVKGIKEAASVEDDLQGALNLLKGTRNRLASSQAEIKEHMGIASQQRQKQALAQMEGTLLKIKQAALLRNQLKEAQENGEYAACFLLCAENCKLLETLQSLSVTGELFASVNQLYADTISRLEAALSSTCADFESSQYCKVLEGYGFLRNTAGLGEEVNSCFVSIITSSALKVVRGVVLTRAGLEEKARSTTILQEIVKYLPPDLYRQCLARVLMVIFDILASHHRMLMWHEAAVESLLRESTELQRAATSASQESRTQNGAGPSTERDAEHAEAADLRIPPDSYAQASTAIVATSPARANLGHGSKHSIQHEDFPLDRRKSGSLAEASGEDAAGSPSARHRLTGTLSRSLRSFGSGNLPTQEGADEEQRDLLSNSTEPASIAQQLESNAMWSEALVSVAESMTSGRRWIWDEAARKVATLLAAPAALQGEHFLQALEWTQSIAQIGEAFSLSKSSSLRDAMQRHSGRFFQAYHASNLQALQTMLEQELWKQLPTPAGRQPYFKAALEGRGEGPAGISLNSTSFADWVAAGNPWKRQDSATVTPNASVHGPSANGSSAHRSEDGYQEKPERKINDPLTNGGQPPAGPPAVENSVVTAASWRMLQWMTHYADLMRMLPGNSGTIYSGCCQLFELYFLHVFYHFSNVSMADLLQGQASQGRLDVVPARLQNSVARVIHRSLPRLKQVYAPQLVASANGQEPGSGPPAQEPKPSVGQQNPQTLPAAISNPGNMYGLQERRVAVESLMTVARQLQSAHTVLAEKLQTTMNIPDHHSLEVFMQTVKAASDLGDVILRAAARLNLPIVWVPGRLSEQNFDLEEPPTKASPWVGVLLNHLRVFHQRLEMVGGIDRDDILKLWQSGLQYVAEVVLEGLARAGAKGRCTVMGRSAMSLDLQGLQRGLQGLAAGKQDMAASALRIVDAYIKAYYIPLGPELRRWAVTHPEYTKDQIFALVSCIAEANNMKRRDRQTLFAEVDNDLRMMQ